MFYNDWVYEKVCLDETFKLTTALDRAITQNPCYVPLNLEKWNLQTEN